MQQDYVMILMLVGIISISLVLGYGYGLRIFKRRQCRLEKRLPNGDAEYYFAPSEDGAIELCLSKKAIKTVLRGEMVEGILKGAKGKMVFRVKRIS